MKASDAEWTSSGFLSSSPSLHIWCPPNRKPSYLSTQQNCNNVGQQEHVRHCFNLLQKNFPSADSAEFSSLTTKIACGRTLLGMLFAKELPVVPAVRSAWRNTAQPKEKGGVVTARRMLHPFHKGLVSSMVHAEGLQEIPMVNAPVVGNKLIHLPAFSRPSVRTRLMANMELEVSVETEAGVGATASQLIKMRYRFVQALLQMLAHAAKNALIQLVPQKGNNGVASARQRRPRYLKELVSLMIPVLELQTVPMKTPPVRAAIKNMCLHAIKQ